MSRAEPSRDGGVNRAVIESRRRTDGRGGASPGRKAGGRFVREFLAPTNSLLLLLLLTFATYGTHLPGDPRGSFDHVREGNRRALPPSPSLHRFSHDLLRHPLFCSRLPGRATWSETRLWKAAHFAGGRFSRSTSEPITSTQSLTLRSNLVTSSAHGRLTRLGRCATQARLQQIKRYGPIGGSAQRLRTTGLAGAIRYVLTRQGEPMATYCADRR